MMSRPSFRALTSWRPTGTGTARAVDGAHRRPLRGDRPLALERDSLSVVRGRDRSAAGRFRARFHAPTAR